MSKAPSDIKPDVETLSGAFDQLAKGDTASVKANSTKLQAASTHLQTYAKDTCKVDLKSAT